MLASDFTGGVSLGDGLTEAGRDARAGVDAIGGGDEAGGMAGVGNGVNPGAGIEATTGLGAEVIGALDGTVAVAVAVGAVTAGAVGDDGGGGAAMIAAKGPDCVAGGDSG